MNNLSQVVQIHYLVFNNLLLQCIILKIYDYFILVLMHNQNSKITCSSQNLAKSFKKYILIRDLAWNWYINYFSRFQQHYTIAHLYLQFIEPLNTGNKFEIISVYSKWGLPMLQMFCNYINFFQNKVIIVI